MRNTDSDILLMFLANCRNCAESCLTFRTKEKTLPLWYLEMPNCCELQNEFRGIFGHELRVQEKDRLPNLAGKASLTAKMPIVRMTCGTSDFLLNQNRRFAKEMRTLIPDFQYEEWEGAHDWTFWNQSLERMLHEFGC